MAVTVFPCWLSGTIAAPPSKSDFQRACAAALLYNGRTTLIHPGTSADDAAALQLAVDLGLTIVSRNAHEIQVDSSGTVRPRTDTVFCGESGLATRLFIPIAALSNQKITFSGSGSLLNRPIRFFYDVLPRLGVSVWGNAQTLPITVQGPLKPQSLTVDGSVSSQFSSGLLMALSAAVTEAVTLQIEQAVSQPYLDMTVATLQAFGKTVLPEANGVYRIKPATIPSGTGLVYPVEGDWSSSAAWLVAAALGAPVSIERLSADSLQADRSILDIFSQTGLKSSFTSGVLSVSGSPQNGFLFDATHAPDLVPVLAVLACSLPGESRICGLHRLLHKESNRLESVTHLLRNGGIRFTVTGDCLTIPGHQSFSACEVHSFNDHRIVMAATLAALQASGPITITDESAIRKSYPAFLDDFRALGGVAEFR
ncbi:MAG: 3-phosphoshikimate 1-carboxyvinyltransferase [Sphingobacteriales bacterium]|nr:MAG: 3-phosphoshikimate 1-carboxyvinyltransferase [Sphingobacteriales bacterium]